jgi:hypothetical protein
MFGPDGEIASGPTVYLNTLGQGRVRFPFVFQKPQDGNFSPRSGNWSIDMEQRFGPAVLFRLRYLQNDSSGLVVLNPLPPDPISGAGSILLGGSGGARYRQVESTVRVRLESEREVYFSYVYSRARGDWNDFGTYLTTFPAPLIHPNEFGDLPASLPHRFLSWGTFRLPSKFRIYPSLEYRSGFPYREADAIQNWVSAADLKRFPHFFSLDSRVSKDIQVTKKYAVRFGVSGFNLTNHFNPEAVHANTADPNFGFFFGHRGRRFTADFDVLF